MTIFIILRDILISFTYGTLLSARYRTCPISNKISWSAGSCYTVEPQYNEDLGTMKITLLYQVSHYIRVQKQRNIKSWDQQNYLVIRGFCYKISDLFITRFHCTKFPLYQRLCHTAIGPLESLILPTSVALCGRGVLGDDER